MRQQTKETFFLLAVSTVLAIAISRAYAFPVLDDIIPKVQAQQAQTK